MGDTATVTRTRGDACAHYIRGCCSADLDCGDEIKCTLPGVTETTPPYSWCQPKGEACPISCGSWQHECSYDGTRTCKPLTEPCPLECAKGQNKCTEPGEDGTTLPHYWCTAAGQACPIKCGSGEEKCIRSDGTEWCAPLTTDMATEFCPVECATSQNKCTEPGTVKQRRRRRWRQL